MSEPRPRWTTTPNATTFQIPTAWLNAPINRSLRHWIDEWSAADPSATRSGDVCTVTLPHSLWMDAGTPSDADLDPEHADLFRARHSAIGQLLGVETQRIRLESIGHIGAPQLAFVLSVGGVRIADELEPTPFPKDGSGHTHALLPCAFVVFRRLCEFNARGSSSRNEQIAFLGELRDQLERSARLLGDASVPFAFELDDHLDKFKVRKVDAVSVSWQPHNEKGTVFDLKLEELDSDGRREPLDLRKLDPETPVIAVSSTEHLLLDPNVETVARVAQKQTNKLRKHVERHFHNPASLFPEGISLENIDLSAYSPRVIGFAPILKAERFVDIRSSGTEWYQRDDDGAGSFLRLDIVQPGGGEMASLEFATPEDAEQAVERLEKALEKEPPDIVELGNQRVEPTRALADRIKQDLSKFRARGNAAEDGKLGGASDKGSGRVAAVISDEVKPATRAAESGADADVPWQRLNELLAPGVGLKPHQRAGVEWMWTQYRRRQAGVLLADDMGLGKTLQIAAFLALQRDALQESERTPSLIVCPVILLENWQAELTKFFRPQVFGSLLVLHGDGLRRHKRGGSIDLDAVGKFAYVLANYETLQSHQQSLLQLNWNIVALDEAHAIKNPDTYRARAARGLKRRFAICSTGTPVENRLSDLWAQYDFLSPGDPFSTRKQFTAEYEDELETGIQKVRRALRYPGATSSLLRRSKSEVLDLPKKTVHAHPVAMTDRQVELERSIIRQGEQSGGILEILSKLQKLYQHPRLLLPESERAAISIDRALEESPKLARTLELLREIQKTGEKVLVFTLWTAMQELLVDVIREKLGLARVRVINGEPAQRARAHEYIKEFSARDGFDVLVLSPLAAGTGLTITAANHVIHYGRWWNPAKEDQATDRCYRIGQERPVQVHYPLLHHPGNPTAGFDIKLHELVEGKRGMAREFLAPQVSDISAADLARVEGA